MVIWTIGDFPAYRMMAGCVTKGFVGCPVCGLSFRSRRSKVLHKNVFCNCARRWLDDDHHMKMDIEKFGIIEHRRAPFPVTSAQAFQYANARERWILEHLLQMIPYGKMASSGSLPSTYYHTGVQVIFSFTIMTWGWT